jgi:predicted transcriptional regulator of viral defense system
MKRIKLTEHELSILETALIEYGAVVTFDQLSGLFDENREYTRKRISKLTKQGWLKRIKRGIYVITDLSSRGTLSISHLAIVNVFVEDSYISFETALQHHGLFDQLHTKIISISLTRYKASTIDGITYNFIKTQQQYFYGWKTYDIDGQSVKIADAEKALIDMLQFHRSLFSTDLVLEKLRVYQHMIENQRLVEYGLKANLTARRILGFLMDCVGLDTRDLLVSVAEGQSVSSISDSKNNVYNHKWKLYYDQYFERWINE